MIVFIPFFFFGGYFIYALAAAFAFFGTYELVKMHNSKNNLPSIFNIIVTILHIPFVIIMIICTIKAFQDYKKEKDENNKE